MPTAADEDWSTAVMMNPASTPKIGFAKARSMLLNASDSVRGDMASDIVLIPTISMEKPRSIMPMSRFLSRLAIIRSTAPINASTGTKLSGLMSRSQKPVPLILLRESIQAVAVVPMLAPMIMPMEFSRVIIPEFTKPMTITMVAPEDCITAVTPAPSRTPATLLEVRRSSAFFKLPPAWRPMASLRTCIPKRNIASPPKKVNRENRSM